MQFGVHAGLSSRRSRVQIPSGPPPRRPVGSASPGRVAQLAERAPEKCEVTGSTPVPTTIGKTPSVGSEREGGHVGALDGIRVVEAGLLVQGPQAAATLGEWGADVIKVELPGFGDQSRWIPVAADRLAGAVLHRLQPREAQHHHRPARARRARALPAARRRRRRRHHQLQAGHDGRVGPRLRGRRRPQPGRRLRHRLDVRADRSRRPARGRRPRRAGRRRAHQHDRSPRRRADAGRRHRSPTTPRPRTS